jgi:DNA-binding LytR/AlgR family response regulator
VTAALPTALIADDEPLLRDSLERMLVHAWPELRVVARARNGREAVDQFEALRPDVCFLDVHMPGLTGVEAAKRIGHEAHVVFVTAFDQYAVQAFAQGVLDYLVKPVEPARLAETITRLQERLRAAQPALNTEALIRELAEQLQRARAGSATQPLRWIRASIGTSVRLIPIDDVDFLRSEDKYTLIAWRDEAGQPREAVIRTPLKELTPQLEPIQFAQVHRSVVVNLRSIDHVTRHLNETAEIHLRGRGDVLPVSRNYLHVFRQM